MVSDQEFEDLQRRMAALESQLAELSGRAEAEGEVSAAVADGEQTIGRVVAALRRHADQLGLPVTTTGGPLGNYHPADFDRQLFLARELRSLATEIEGGGA